MPKIKIPTGRNGQFTAVIDTNEIESVSDLGKKATAVRMKSGVTHTGPISFDDLTKLLGWEKAKEISAANKNQSEK